MPWIVSYGILDNTGPAENRIAFEVGPDLIVIDHGGGQFAEGKILAVQKSERYCARDQQILCDVLNRDFPDDPVKAKETFVNYGGFKKWASQFLRW